MKNIVFAPAKLTLTLRVTGVRDDGYHLLDAEMVTLSFGDTLRFDDVDGGDIALSASGPHAEGMPLDRSNIVATALTTVGRTARVHIDKQIPHGGGLGGGSADAAAVLRWAGFDRSPESLRRASHIGADVAFCLVGGRARVRGIGELIEPLPYVERTVTLVVPPLRVSTPAVYRAWDDLGGPTAEGPNDLEPAAIAVAPDLARWRDRIAEACGERPILAGSGATWFVHGEHSNALATLSDEGVEVVTASTVDSTFGPDVTERPTTAET